MAEVNNGINGAAEPTDQINGNAQSKPKDNHQNGVAKDPKEEPAPREKETNAPSDSPNAQNGKTGKLKNHVKTLKPDTPPGGFDQTPLPRAPQGYTVRFIFESAANLPPSDLSTASSDPYIHATLKANNPKRHREDPDLTYRTRTQRETVNPKWNDEWVVANVPPSGFSLKCRLYDEDARDADDRLGNVTIKVPQLSETWKGMPRPGKEFEAKKRVISKRAYFMKAISSIVHSNVHMTPLVTVSIEVLGKSETPNGQMFTVGPTRYVKHFSPMIGRLTGTKVDSQEEDGKQDTQASNQGPGEKKKDKPKTKKYDFQANEMQLEGPVPLKLYHRFVEFRPIIGSMFTSSGLRGKILHMALHKQHKRVYNYDQSTEYGSFDPCSEAASMDFLRLAHFDKGGRIFTYVLTLDAQFRFTETGKEFGIDLLSKHTMHSDVQRYIACSGEFFIRRLERPEASDDVHPDEKVHPTDRIEGGPPKADPPSDPSYYQLIIDNDSGTYRPDKSILPQLKEFLEKNFPGLGIIALHCDDDNLKEMKKAQNEAKKKEGKPLNVVMNKSQSSISSAESDLEDREHGWETEGGQSKSKKEAALEAVENPKRIKEALGSVLPK